MFPLKLPAPSISVAPEAIVSVPLGKAVLELEQSSVPAVPIETPPVALDEAAVAESFKVPDVTV
jgi:hypothetical protein